MEDVARYLCRAYVSATIAGRFDLLTRYCNWHLRLPAYKPTPPIFSVHCYAVRHTKTFGQFGEASVQRP